MKIPMHLSTLGKEHMLEVGQLIKAKGFNLTKIFTSPETRTQESVTQLNKTLKLPVEIVDDLDDVYAPYPYQQGWKMDRLMAIGGNGYNLPLSESPESVTKRMLKVFNTAAGSLKTGQAAILLSHGDPIAFLIYILKTNSVLDPEKIRQVQFPKKGQVAVAVIGAQEKLFTLYLLNPDIEGSAY
jgi:broad specificity phosphatase PhoE